jgi:hypothetical protein
MRVSSLLPALALLLGCSAIIEPDERLLGGADGASPADGGSEGDGGGDTDSGGGDGATACPTTCDDGVACTVDSCVGGECVRTPDDGACGDGERCNPVLGCVPVRCARDEECDDGLHCTGVERCDPAAEGTGCIAGANVECDDGASCTSDACDEDADGCVFTPSDAACADTVDCTSDRCDPSSAGGAPTGCVHEADDSLCATDYCTVGSTCDAATGCTAGTPRDCRDTTLCTEDACDTTMCVHTLRDDDMDGVGAAEVPGTGGVPISCGGMDCDDTDPLVAPGMPERCNLRDDDCDGTVDDGCPAMLPDVCRTANQVVLDSDGRGSARGTFSDFADDYRANAICNPGTGGRDAVYYVDLPRGTNDVVIDTIGSSADTVLAIGFECSAAGFQAACNDDYAGASVSTSSRIWVHRVGSLLSTTRLYILVDGYSSSTSGDFVLNVNRNAAGPDSCPSAIGGSLPLDITGGGTVLGFQTELVGSERGSCQPALDTSGEAIFRVRGSPSGNADFDVYSADFVPDVYFRSSPCGSGAERDCVVGSAIGGGINRARLTDGVTDGALYYLFVDGGRGSYAVYYRPY